MSSDDNKPFDPFELTAAILLGIGAIGASLAGHQEGLWGGQSVEAYGEAAALTTKASSTYNDELTTYMQDTQIDIRSKELIWEGDESKDEDASARVLGMANWMLLTQVSDSAYKYLKLPEATRKAYWEGDEEQSLTGREFALLSELAGHTDETLTRSELLHSVWGASFDGEPNIVDVYVGYLRAKLRKLGEHSVEIEAVRGVGFRLVTSRVDRAR